MTLDGILERAEQLYRDVDLQAVRAWKAARAGGHAIGQPVYAPREIVHAAGMLPVGIVGGGDQLEIVRGDAYFQSYICHIPRSVVEMGLSAGSIAWTECDGEQVARDAEHREGRRGLDCETCNRVIRKKKTAGTSTAKCRPRGVEMSPAANALRRAP